MVWLTQCCSQNGCCEHSSFRTCFLSRSSCFIVNGWSYVYADLQAWIECSTSTSKPGRESSSWWTKCSLCLSTFGREERNLYVNENIGLQHRCCSLQVLFFIIVWRRAQGGGGGGGGGHLPSPGFGRTLVEKKKIACKETQNQLTVDRIAFQSTLECVEAPRVNRPTHHKLSLCFIRTESQLQPFASIASSGQATTPRVLCLPVNTQRRLDKSPVEFCYVQRMSCHLFWLTSALD